MFNWLCHFQISLPADADCPTLLPHMVIHLSFLLKTKIGNSFNQHHLGWHCGCGVVISLFVVPHSSLTFTFHSANIVCHYFRTGGLRGGNYQINMLWHRSKCGYINFSGLHYVSSFLIYKSKIGFKYISDFIYFMYLLKTVTVDFDKGSIEILSCHVRRSLIFGI